MDSSTWAAVWIGGALIALTVVVFLLSLVPPDARAWARAELASWPDQWRDLRTDVRSWWHHHGRHVTGAPVHDPIECVCDLTLADALGNDRAVEDGVAAYAHEPGCNTPHDGPDPCPPPRDTSQDVQVIRDDSPTEIITEGATEDWSPKAELAAVPERPAPKPVVRLVVHTEPDEFERSLTARFDAIVDGLRHVPDELVTFGKTVDASLERAGLDSEQHRRWRAGAFVVDTGEFSKVFA